MHLKKIIYLQLFFYKFYLNKLYNLNKIFFLNIYIKDNLKIKYIHEIIFKSIFNNMFHIYNLW